MTEDEDYTNALDKRLFYLMLNVTDGQKYAQDMGFPPPSEDVVEVETVDILSRWAMIVASGVFSHIAEATDWYTDWLSSTDKLHTPEEEFRVVLSIFGVALINKLLDNQNVVLMVDTDTYEELEDE
jgi:hypothetical protein